MNYRNRKSVVLLTLSGLIGLMLVWAAVQSVRPGPVTLKSGQAEPAPAKEEPPSTGLSPTSPPLQIETAGRLPQAIQGLRLGMTPSDALALVPNLKQRTANASSGATLFYGDTARGLETGLFFKQGRLYEMELSMDVLSPADRDLILKDTLANLGPPTKQIWNFPETTQFVWVDGDVRIAYNDEGSGPRHNDPPRYVTLFMVHWPSYLEVATKETEELITKSNDITAQSHTVFQQEELVKWGDVVFIPRPLPREIGPVQLRMAPWQSRAALASDAWHLSTSNIFVGSCNEDCERWERAGLAIEVRFWHNKVIRMKEDFGELTTEEGQNRLRQWLADFGTPVEASTFGGPEAQWTDGQVWLLCTAAIKETHNGPFRAECDLDDLELSRVVAADGFHGNYDAAPAKSFF